LATDVADPWQRLLTISQVMTSAKELLRVSEPELVLKRLDAIPPIIMRARSRTSKRQGVAPESKSEVNISVSNFGRLQDLRLGSSEVEEFYMSGTPTSGSGSSIAIYTYRTSLMVSILAFADAIEFPAELADHLQEALAELVVLSSVR
jgi:hypothetical protein